ncbi:MAG TPA: 23S rRNA (adenine(2503)-C(2))-methyltransferase RlmN [Candidatus Cloacimonas sp.]|jgi:23S rRNA (adenine2503-C2)-methyltransferase|nr:23S rRNA (adenine(2503)-C(2))-methyltransferase RlmN [Candidatus Cloacimonas sp.]HPS59958.1 23S rRNA (adenine(2503)-C(2))-methyltransferase RlmN [Candidatus Cloacimonas sp.]
MLTNVFSMLPEELARNILSRQPGIPAYRTKQLLFWLYKSFCGEPEKMTNLPEEYKAFLQSNYSFFLPAIESKLVSRDGAIKYRLKLEDGKLIESVLIPTEKKNTLCISTQVGCAHNCIFCSTGKMGFIRNLETQEIIGQVILAEKEQKDSGNNKLTNLVLMGMGEPLNNLQKVLEALKILQSNEGLSFSPRRITVSTCGIVPGIIALADSGVKTKLALSLNSAIQTKRNQLMPVSKQYNLIQLKQALLYYLRKTSFRVTLEYILIPEFNMNNEDLTALRKFTGDLSCKINFIPYNPGRGSRFRAPTETEIKNFMSKAQNLPQAITLRKSRGADIFGACGQLTDNNRGEI